MIMYDHTVSTQNVQTLEILATMVLAELHATARQPHWILPKRICRASEGME